MTTPNLLYIDDGTAYQQAQFRDVRCCFTYRLRQLGLRWCSPAQRLSLAGQREVNAETGTVFGEPLERRGKPRRDYQRRTRDGKRQREHSRKSYHRRVARADIVGAKHDARLSKLVYVGLDTFFRR